MNDYKITLIQARQGVKKLWEKLDANEEEKKQMKSDIAYLKKKTTRI